MAFATIDVTKGITGVTPVANGGTAISSGFKNGVDPRKNAEPILINGDMQVSQRTTSEASITDNRYSSCDRFKIEIDSCGTWTVAQETLTSGNAYNNGFRKALRLDCTTADASPAAADAVIVSHRMEGQNLNVFKKGTSSAEKYTLAFWIKSNKTGTAQVNFTDEENTRMCSGQYTISSANTWEKKVINIAADTSGASDNDNTESIRISWWFDAGSNYTGGAVPTAWEATSASDKGVSTLSLANSTSNDVAITGVQLEVGEYTSATIPPFQHEDFGDNLLRCQRYYNIFGNTTQAPMGMAAFYSDASAYVGPLVYPVEMRSSPSITITGGSGNAYETAGFALNHSASNDWFQTFASSATSTKELQLYAGSGVSAADGDAGRCKIGDSEANKGKIEASAEL